QTVTWTESDASTPDLIGAVEIWYSPTGDVDTDGVRLADNILTHETCSTITAPSALSYDSAVIRVRDDDANFADYVTGDSAAFRVLGRIIYGASPASGDNWYIGETTKTVTWTAYGNEMTSVDIYIDYDGEGGAAKIYQKTESTTPGSPDSWTFDDISVSVDGVGDHVTEDAIIIIEDSDANRKALTSYNSPTFNIAGRFENIVAEATTDPEENTEVVAGLGATITWDKTGTAITNALMEYSTNAGTNWYNIVTDTEGDTTTLITNNESYSWAVPEAAISDSCLIRITDPDNSSATGQSASNFIIASKVKVLQPDVNDSWDTNTTETIQWQKWGDFATVNIYYRPDDQTSWTLLNTDAPKPSCQDEIDGLGDTLNGSWDWYIDENTVLSPTAQIKVEDAVNSTATLAVLSDEFTTKGSLEVLWPNATDYNVYEAGIAKDIKWKRYGNIEGVKVFLDDGASGYSLITELGTGGTVDFVGAETEHTESWTPPEAIGTTYTIKVQDKNNSTIEAESPAFKVKGKLKITDPDLQQPTWYITDTARRIRWDVQHGNIPFVKIELSPSGNFDGDEYIIIGQTQADNEILFDSANTPVAKGFYDWDIGRDTPLSETARIRVKDYNETDYDSVASSSGADLTIRGKITVHTPSGDWNVGDTDKTITWDAYGGISTVWIDFYDGNQWLTDINGVAGTACGDGDNKSFSVANWDGENMIPDMKSANCQIRIRNAASNPTIQETSDTFYVYPTITNVDIIPSAGDEGEDHTIWRAGLTNQTVTWTENDLATPTLIDTVDIVYSKSGTFGGDEVTLLEDVTTHETTSAITAPTDLSYQSAKIRVQDNDAGFESKVYADSTETFSVLGRVVYGASPSEGDNWTIGATDKVINWTAYGDQMTQVDIYIDYGSGYVYQKTEDTVPGSADSWTYDDIDAGVDGVGDYAAENVTVRIEDVDASRKPYTQYVSPAFNIVGGFEWVYPLGGETFHVDNDATPTALQLQWKTTGSDISKVKIEYYHDTNGWTVIDSNVTNTYGDGTSINTYNWDINSSLPLPVDYASSNMKFRITSSVPDHPITAEESNAIAYVGNIAVTSPSQGDIWVADGATANTISWDVYGKVDNVKISYTRDSGSNWVELVSSMSAEAGDATANKGAYDWTIPTDPSLGDYITRVDAGDESYIKVEDATIGLGIFAYDESLDFIVKGQLSLVTPSSATLADGFTGRDSTQITWQRSGRINAVNVKYATDGVTFSNVIEADRTFATTAALQQSLTSNWIIPETPLLTTYKILVEDTNYEKSGTNGTYILSDPFTVRGALTLTEPSSTTTWRITEEHTITWDVDHGQINKVKVIASPSGNFSGDEYTVATNLDPFNVSAFSAVATPVGSGSYDWTIP
ncbi:hypothetical protein DRH29_04585, partial [candidate division Kazan bacterium]